MVPLHRRDAQGHHRLPAWRAGAKPHSPILVRDARYGLAHGGYHTLREDIGVLLRLRLTLVRFLWVGREACPYTSPRIQPDALRLPALDARAD